MRAVHVEIGARCGGQRRAFTRLPQRQLVGILRHGIEMPVRDHPAQPGMRQIARLRADRDHRPVEPVTFLALVLVGNAVTDRLPRRGGQVDPRADHRQLRIGLRLVPQIGQRQPAVRAVQQHARFDQSPFAALAEGKGLDQRRTHRQVEQAFALCAELRPRCAVDKPQFLSAIGIERRVQAIWMDLGHGQLRARIVEKSVVRQQARHPIAHDRGVIDVFGRRRGRTRDHRARKRDSSTGEPCG